MVRRTQVRKVGELLATDEQGARYTVLVFANFHETTTNEPAEVWEKGLEFYRLTSGDPVNRLSEREFQVVSTGQLLST